MNILVIGSGGREHALCWKIAKSRRVSKVYCAPGNGGTSAVAENIDIHSNDIDKLVEFAKENKIDLTIVGPEEPLSLGIVDKFWENDLRIFGADKKCAKLEGSKEFAKKFMDKYYIPTAKYSSFTDYDKAVDGLSEFTYPLVIKADGLCYGKGVVICNNETEAKETLDDMLNKRIFGKEGEKVIIEEFLDGKEASLLCFVTQGKVIPLETARDYKRIYDNDEGPNTGGVGCISPGTILTREMELKIERNIFTNIRFGLENEGMNFRGILFIGLMIVEDEPIVLEFNVRFGDPETEVLVPRIDLDIIDLFQKTIDGTVTLEDLIWTEEVCATVVLTSEGYPGTPEIGYEITGLEDVDESIMVFHNGTKYEDGKLLTNGGRVLSITSLGDTIEDATDNIYKNIDKINFKGMHYRKDIGKDN